MAAGAKGVKLVLLVVSTVPKLLVSKNSNKVVSLTQTLRANIDYCEKKALTRSGYVGIKV